MEVSLVKEIGQSVESVDSFSVGKLMSAGLVCARHYHSVRLDLPMLRLLRSTGTLLAIFSVSINANSAP